MTTFVLPFPPSVNNLFVNGKFGRFRSQRYDSWILEAGCEIRRQRPSKVAGPVILTYEFQEGHDKRKRDLGNLEKAVSDLLVSHQIIEADDGSIVREIKLKWNPEVQGVRVNVASFFTAFPSKDKDNARVA
jgi:crossover junction endodeoxyribonuclease RusA